MKHRMQFRALAVPVVMALLVSAFFVSPALADDSLPPPEPTTEERTTETPAEKGSSEPATSEAATREREEPTVAGVLEQLPEGSELVVTNERGEPMPLAAEETAEAIYSGADPMWCKAGVTPGSVGCFGFSSMTDMLNNLNAANPAYAVTIWIEKIYDSSSAFGDMFVDDFVISGSTLSNTKLYPLTINGGWNGGTTTSMDPNDPSVFQFDSLSVVGWEANITIRNILVTGADSNDGLGSVAGLYVATTKNIVLENVTSSGNTNGLDGAYLYNGGNSANTVTIKNGAFNDNGNNGLNVLTWGAITITHITANDNYNDGAHLDNYSFGLAPVAKPVTISASGVFSGNGDSGVNGEGLEIDATGVVTLSNITATYNRLDGVNINNTYIDPLAAAVIIKGVNNFSSNVDGDGLDITTDGAVSLYSVTANDNWDDGVNINNLNPDIGTPGVTIYYYLQANANGDDGLEIDTLGPVVAANLTLVFNDSMGADIDNSAGSSPKPVTITGTNTFNLSGAAGLTVYSDGAVTVYNATAVDNGQTIEAEGVFVDNADSSLIQSPVKFAGINVFSYNSRSGAYVQSFGAVSFSNVTSYQNGFWSQNGTGSGIVIDNCVDPGPGCTAVAPKAVTLSGSNNLSYNDGEGIDVYATGTVNLSNVTAYYNGESGAYINNYTSLDLVQNVVISGVNVFTNNGDDGIEIYSKGAVTVSKVTATNNSAYGIWVENTDAPAGKAPGVVFSGYVNASYNTWTGLEIRSFGGVSVANASATGNGNNGVYIDTDDAGFYLPVILSGYNLFSGNAAEGLEIYANGSITLSNVTATLNGFTSDVEGVYLNNDNSPGKQYGVTLNGTNMFGDNSFGGLAIDTYGAVTLNNLVALHNGEGWNDILGDGVYVDNTGGTVVKPVSILGTNVFQGNDGDGLFILSSGAVTVSRVGSAYNGGDGIEINNNGLVPSKVVMSGYALLQSNAATGLYVQSSGPVTLSNITALGNSDEGVYIDVMSLSSPQAVTLTGTNSFLYNGFGGAGWGLTVFADGNITISNLTASYNQNGGAQLDNFSNYSFGPVGSVTLLGTSYFTGNVFSHGLSIRTMGNVSLSRVHADGNANIGIRIRADGNVTLTCSSAFQNSSYGLQVHGEVNVDAASLTLLGFQDSLNLGGPMDIGGLTATQKPCP